MAGKRVVMGEGVKDCLEPQANSKGNLMVPSTPGELLIRQEVRQIPLSLPVQ